jgi:hypothetical protein
MKKTVLIVPALFISMLTYAQGSHSVACTADDPVLNKKGHPILPKAGDIALGFNAIPAMDLVFNSLRYVSIMGNSAPVANNVAAPTNQFVQASNNQIVGKYFLEDKAAIRVRVGFNTLSGTMINQVQDAEVMYNATLGTAEDIQAASLIKVDDKLHYSKSNIMITAGYEMRRGYRRLQGYYGGEIGIGGTSARQNVTYGNAFSDVYAVQYTNNFNSFTTNTQLPTSGRTVRNLYTKERGGIRFGLRGFIGIEYFVFAKISIAAEYGWGYSITTRRGAKSTQEVFVNGQSGPTVFQEDVNVDNSEKTKGFSVDNNAGNVFSMNNTLGGNTALSGGAGAITLLFHF